MHSPLPHLFMPSLLYLFCAVYMPVQVVSPVMRVSPGRQPWWLLWEFLRARLLQILQILLYTLASTNSNYWLCWGFLFSYPSDSLLFPSAWSCTDDTGIVDVGSLSSGTLCGVCGYNLSCRVVTHLQNGLGISSAPCSFTLLLTKGSDYFSWIWDGPVIDLANRMWRKHHLEQLLDLATMRKSHITRRGHGKGS